MSIVRSRLFIWKNVIMIAILLFCNHDKGINCYFMKLLASHYLEALNKGSSVSEFSSKIFSTYLSQCLASAVELPNT